MELLKGYGIFHNKNRILLTFWKRAAPDNMAAVTDSQVVFHLEIKF
jgi:hypothetical protein